MRHGTKWDRHSSSKSLKKMSKGSTAVLRSNFSSSSLSRSRLFKEDIGGDFRGISSLSRGDNVHINHQKLMTLEWNVSCTSPTMGIHDSHVWRWTNFVYCCLRTKVMKHQTNDSIVSLSPLGNFYLWTRREIKRIFHAVRPKFIALIASSVWNSMTPFSGL
jgi:hypothetical protein